MNIKQLFFLIESRVKMSELDVAYFSVIELESKDKLDLVEFMAAQVIYGGEYDHNDECFISGDIYVKTGSIKQITEDEYNSLKKLNIADNHFNFEKLQSDCNMTEVETAYQASL